MTPFSGAPFRRRAGVMDSGGGKLLARRSSGWNAGGGTDAVGVVGARGFAGWYDDEKR